ncbi:MAG: hypothetical protein U5L45_15170 [Saprospiraceae bacterium]|nr:hypothetical protein [Saprospiraceae bacterium]
MVHFSASPKNEPHSPLFASEASNRLCSYKNKYDKKCYKLRVLLIIFLKPYINSKYALKGSFALASLAQK